MIKTAIDTTFKAATTSLLIALSLVFLRAQATPSCPAILAGETRTADELKSDLANLFITINQMPDGNEKTLALKTWKEKLQNSAQVLGPTLLDEIRALAQTRLSQSTLDRSQREREREETRRTQTDSLMKFKRQRAHEFKRTFNRFHEALGNDLVLVETVLGLELRSLKDPEFLETYSYPSRGFISSTVQQKDGKAINGVFFPADGKVLHLFRRDSVTGEHSWSEPIPIAFTSDFRFSPNGDLAFAFSDHDKLMVIRLSDFAYAEFTALNVSSTNALITSPDSTKVYYKDSNDLVTVDIATLKVSRQDVTGYMPPTNKYTNAAMAPDSSKMLMVGEPSQVFEIDPANAVLTMSPLAKRVYSVQYSADSRTIYGNSSTFQGPGLLAFDAMNGEQVEIGGETFEDAVSGYVPQLNGPYAIVATKDAKRAWTYWLLNTNARFLERLPKIDDNEFRSMKWSADENSLFLHKSGSNKLIELY